MTQSSIHHPRSSFTEVAAAVIYDAAGRFLLAQRPAGKVYAGYWEFPGGKLHAGESAHDALCRELHEELGITVTRAHAWITRYYQYEHAHVKLSFFRVFEWQGEPHGREGQAFAWATVDAINVAPMLPANAPVLRALALPSVYAITHAGESNVQAFLDQLPGALAAGLRLIQVREPLLAPEERASFARRVIELAHAQQARVLINSDLALAQALNAENERSPTPLVVNVRSPTPLGGNERSPTPLAVGVHLRAAQLFQLDARPEFALVGASCHDRRELERAAELGVDFAVLGPLAATQSHPRAQPLGWTRFGELIRDCTLPVYALGGLSAPDLPRAQAAGAHGVAMMRAAWSVARL